MNQQKIKNISNWNKWKEEAKNDNMYNNLDFPKEPKESEYPFVIVWNIIYGEANFKNIVVLDYVKVYINR